MELVLALGLTLLPPENEKPPQSSPPEVQIAMTCFLESEQESVTNKICVYDCLGSLAVITIPVTKLCPLSIKQ